MKTILIPVDFADGSITTVKYAIYLAGDTETNLHLFHIYPDQLMIPDSSFPNGIDSDGFLNAEFIMEQSRQAERNMQEFAHDVDDLIAKEGYTNINLSHMVTGGDPESEIKDIVNEIKPDLIVMGTRGEGNKGFLEGSMAESIMAKAGVPVLAVPNAAQLMKFQNIMYPTNFSENDFDRIKLLIDVLDRFDCHFHIVHFELKKKLAQDRLLMDALKRGLQSEFPEKKLSFYLMDSVDKATALEDFTTGKGIDLIAFIAHKIRIFRDLFSSKIHKKDFFKLELPMLALHEK